MKKVEYYFTLLLILTATNNVQNSNFIVKNFFFLSILDLSPKNLEFLMCKIAFFLLEKFLQFTNFDIQFSLKITQYTWVKNLLIIAPCTLGVWSRSLWLSGWQADKNWCSLQFVNLIRWVVLWLLPIWRNFPSSSFSSSFSSLASKQPDPFRHFVISIILSQSQLTDSSSLGAYIKDDFWPLPPQ